MMKRSKSSLINTSKYYRRDLLDYIKSSNLITRRPLTYEFTILYDDIIYKFYYISKSYSKDVSKVYIVYIVNLYTPDGLYLQSEFWEVIYRTKSYTIIDINYGNDVKTNVVGPTAKNYYGATIEINNGNLIFNKNRPTTCNIFTNHVSGEPCNEPSYSLGLLKIYEIMDVYSHNFKSCNNKLLFINNNIHILVSEGIIDIEET